MFIKLCELTVQLAQVSHQGRRLSADDAVFIDSLAWDIGLFYQVMRREGWAPGLCILYLVHLLCTYMKGEKSIIKEALF